MTKTQLGRDTGFLPGRADRYLLFSRISPDVDAGFCSDFSLPRRSHGLEGRVTTGLSPGFSYAIRITSYAIRPTPYELCSPLTIVETDAELDGEFTKRIIICAVEHPRWFR